MEDDKLFYVFLFGFLVLIWIARLIFSKKKKEALKEGPIQMTYEDGRTTRDLSGKDTLILCGLLFGGIAILTWWFSRV